MTRRSMNPGFDQRIADWLEDDPDDAPDAVLTTVLAAFPSIPQRRALRVPWRFPAMNRFAQLGAVAVAALAVVGGALFILNPGPSVGTQPSTAPSTPATTPSISPTSSQTAIARSDLEKDFTSARYGYIVAYLPGWSVAPATKSWVAGTANNWSSGYNDEIKGSDIRFSGSAQRLATGQTAAAWLSAYAGAADATIWPVIRIDGLAGRLDADGVTAAGGTVAPGGVMFDAVVVKDGFAYNFNMDGHLDRATFDAVVSTIRLPTVPALTNRFTSAMGGYTVAYPSSWTVAPATKAWTTGYDTLSVSDAIGSGAMTIGTDPVFYGASTKLPVGTSFETWFAGYDADRAHGTCGAPSQNEDLAVDGVLGHLDVHCPTSYLEFVVGKGGRAYVFTMYMPTSPPLLDSILATVALDPASAKN